MAEVFPLQCTGVLEFVYHHMLIADAGFFEDEICIARAQGLGKRAGCFGKQTAIVLLQYAVDGISEILYQHQITQMLGQQFFAHPCGTEVLRQVYNAVHHCVSLLPVTAFVEGLEILFYAYVFCLVFGKRIERYLFLFQSIV